MIVALVLAAAVGPAGQSFDCTPTAVWDGDGPIRCAEGPHLRLSGIAARDGGLVPSRPSRPAADPIAARDRLAELVGTPQGKMRTGHVRVSGPTMRSRSAGGAGGTRPAAFCVSPKSGNLSCAIVRDG